MSVNGCGFRAIERVKKVHHNTTLIYWVKQIGSEMPEVAETTEITEIDELETFVGSKKTKFGSGA